MRIILWLAAGLSVATSGGAAAAERAVGSMVRGGSPHGAWKPGGFGHGWKIMRPDRPRPGRGHGHHDGRDRHRGHDWRADPNILHSYGGGIAYSYEAVDPHGGGFFARGGGEVRVQGGRPHYDYDRSYPYEWASRAGGRESWANVERGGPSLVHCGRERGVRVCRGGR
jgi:hypothetical protein